MNTDLSIIIVSWNVRDRLRECLRSIFDTIAESSVQLEVFVVDNASKDQSVEMVRSEFPKVHCVANRENFGFARANNQGIEESRIKNHESWASEFVLLLNPDMRVLPGSLSGIVAFMRERRNARVGIAGCRLVDECGEVVPHVRRFPRLLDQFVTLTKLSKLAPRLLNRYLIHDFDYSREARVDSVRGSFFCIRRKLIEQIGALDERFFIWFEEVDLCMRARQSGWQVAYTPLVTCVDYIGQSFKQVELYSKQRMFSRSMLTYFRKHRPRWEWAVLAAVRPFVLGAAWVHDRMIARR
ncbi:MAG: glycosyltransferase family 2 protein [bacterium]|nr:glycosyltransferase family 2 protein [bacterium]